MLLLDDKVIATDKNGYLSHIDEWSEAIAELIAEQEGVVLTTDHWDVIYLLRQFYQEFDLSPAMRPFVKYVGTHLGQDKGSSIYLLQLFPPSPAKIASKIAGLPRPTHCL